MEMFTKIAVQRISKIVISGCEFQMAEAQDYYLGCNEWSRWYNDKNTISVNNPTLTY